MIAALKKFFRKEEVDNIRNIIINKGGGGEGMELPKKQHVEIPGVN